MGFTINYKKTRFSLVRMSRFFIDFVAHVQIDSRQFYICALTLSCGSIKSFNVVLLDCNEPLLSAMRCSWKTRCSRLCVLSFDIVCSLLLVSIELQRRKHPIFDKWTSTNGAKELIELKSIRERSEWFTHLTTPCRESAALSKLVSPSE